MGSGERSGEDHSAWARSGTADSHDLKSLDASAGKLPARIFRRDSPKTPIDWREEFRILVPAERKDLSMSMLKKILAPTDFSDVSAAGVRYACQLAKDLAAEIIIFNVDFTGWGDDPQGGYAIFRPGGGCPACDMIRGVTGGR